MEITHSVEIHKNAKRTLDDESTQRKVEQVVKRVINDAREKRGWKYAISFPNRMIKDGEYLYRANLKFRCVPERERQPEIVEREFVAIRHLIAAGFNQSGWVIRIIDGKLITESFDEKLPEVVSYVDINIPNNWDSYFSHIYERDEHIGIIKSSVQAGIDSDWRNRFHCLLFGDVACGKTEIALSVEQVFGPDACLKFDATLTTQAGAIQELTSRPQQPRILIMEELEKITSEDSFHFLLGLLDDRAEIRKLTKRENIVQETKLLGIATVNNMDTFEKMMSGALVSRFPWKLFCKRPERPVLERILAREIAKMPGGNLDWIKPALDYAFHYGIYDPREHKAICLCGRNDLLNGKHQKRMEKTRKPMK